MESKVLWRETLNNGVLPISHFTHKTQEKATFKDNEEPFEKQEDIFYKPVKDIKAAFTPSVGAIGYLKSSKAYIKTIAVFKNEQGVAESMKVETLEEKD